VIRVTRGRRLRADGQAPPGAEHLSTAAVHPSGPLQRGPRGARRLLPPTVRLLRRRVACAVCARAGHAGGRHASTAATRRRWGGDARLRARARRRARAGGRAHGRTRVGRRPARGARIGTDATCDATAAGGAAGWWPRSVAPVAAGARGQTSAGRASEQAAPLRRIRQPASARLLCGALRRMTPAATDDTRCDGLHPVPRIKHRTAENQLPTVRRQTARAPRRRSGAPLCVTPGAARRGGGRRIGPGPGRGPRGACGMPSRRGGVRIAPAGTCRVGW
jgi:hypothetical protein